MVLGPAGGQLAIMGLTLVVPSGALAAPTTITLGPTAASSGGDLTVLSSPAVIGPAGLAFVDPATLEFTIAAPPQGATVYCAASATGPFAAIGGTVTGNVVSAPISGSAVCFVGVPKGDGGAGGGGTAGTGGNAGSGGGAQWYMTCGDPSCHGHTPQPGVPACTGQQPGDPCTSPGLQCDPGNFCNSLLLCSTTNPVGRFGCPISRRRFKRDITYVAADDLERLSNKLLSIPLARYRYKADPAAAEHLGFIIDDIVPAECVSPGGDTVDLYGYTSMAVATLKVQAKQIEQLSREIAALRAEVKATPHRPQH
jgi:hypothetical protein